MEMKQILLETQADIEEGVADSTRYTTTDIRRSTATATDAEKATDADADIGYHTHSHKHKQKPTHTQPQ